MSTEAMAEASTDRAALRRRAAILIALLDSAAPIPYLLGFDPYLVQLPSIALKLLIVVLLPSITNASPSRTFFLWSVVLLALIGTLVDAFSGLANWQPILRYWAFAVSMFGTLSLVANSHYGAYASAIVLLPTLGAALHTVMALSGEVPLHFGRYLYFRGSHPNLGGEIAAAAGIAAALALRVRWLLPTVAVLLGDCMLMQSRAAILTIALAVGVRLLWSRRGASLALVGGALLLALVAVQSNFNPVRFVSEILQVDDQYRGASSGFAGRSLRWDYALSLFYESPIWGVGLSVFSVSDVGDPHNAFLYGLASHGATSFIFWLALATALYWIARTNPRDAVILSTGLVLLVFNDRFINLNIYPLAYYALVVCYPAATSRVASAVRQTHRLTGEGRFSAGDIR